jgi:hypothetical protein
LGKLRSAEDLMGQAITAINWIKIFTTNTYTYFNAKIQSVMPEKIQ